MPRAHTVTVYSFHTFDDGVELPVLSRYKCTRQAIEAVGGNLVEGTGEEVEVAALDREGRYRRIATGWGELAD